MGRGYFKNSLCTRAHAALKVRSSSNEKNIVSCSFLLHFKRFRSQCPLRNTPPKNLHNGVPWAFFTLCDHKKHAGSSFLYTSSGAGLKGKIAVNLTGQMTSLAEVKTRGIRTLFLRFASSCMILLLTTLYL